MKYKQMLKIRKTEKDPQVRDRILLNVLVKRDGMSMTGAALHLGMAPSWGVRWHNRYLEEAIKNHGKPASIMTDHGSQFYANASEAKKKGASDFEKRLVGLGIHQILARVKHPQTNGKLERLHGEIQRKLPEFEAILMRKSDPIDLFMQWYNYDRPHMSLNRDERETPAQAFVRKMPPKGETVIDEQTGEEYRAA